MRHLFPPRLLPLLLLAAPLASAAPAAAVEPTRETMTSHRLVDPFVVCDGFTITGSFDRVREVTTFLDASGTPIRRIARVILGGTVRNATTGAELPVSGIRVFHYDLADGTTTSTGSNVLVRPGSGSAIVLGAGRLEFDSSGRVVETHGPDPGREEEQLCAALAA